MEPVDKWRDLSGGNLIVSSCSVIFTCMNDLCVFRVVCMKMPTDGGICSSPMSCSL